MPCRDDKDTGLGLKPIGIGRGFPIGRRRRLPIGQPSPLPAPGAPLRPPGMTWTKNTFDVKARGSHELPLLTVPESPPMRKGFAPVGAGNTLSQPQLPRTSQPYYLAQRNPAMVWAFRHPVRPIIADWTPIDGQARMLPGGNVIGGMPLRLPHTYSGMEHLLPFDMRSRQRKKEFDLAIRHRRYMQKRPVLLVGGPAPGQFAKALRGKPGTPNFWQGWGSQEPARRTSLRGRLAMQDWAPRPILERMARQAATYQENQ